MRKTSVLLAVSALLACAVRVAWGGTSSTPSDDGLAGVTVLVMFLILAGILFYFLPIIVAISRKVQNKVPTALVNIFLGWTFIGWIVALIMAFSAETRDQAMLREAAYRSMAGFTQPRR